MESRAGFRYVFWVLSLAVWGGAGCGYTFQTSRSPLLENEGIRRIYVTPLLNNTYKAGVENVVYNALLRTLATGRRVTLVHSEAEADAVLSGVITEAQSYPLSETKLSTPPFTDRWVYSVFSAGLGGRFTLVRKNPPPGKKAILWSSNFSRNKPYPAPNRIGVAGTTEALILGSEFDQAVSDLATSMMGDVHESMLAMF